MLTAILVLVTGAVTGWMLVGNSSGPVPLVLVIGCYIVAAYRPMREVLAAAAVMACLLIVLALRRTRLRPGRLRCHVRRVRRSLSHRSDRTIPA
jgi:hypothetical protein